MQNVSYSVEKRNHGRSKHFKNCVVNLGISDLIYNNC